MKRRSFLKGAAAAPIGAATLAYGDHKRLDKVEFTHAPTRFHAITSVQQPLMFTAASPDDYEHMIAKEGRRIKEGLSENIHNITPREQPFTLNQRSAEYKRAVATWKERQELREFNELFAKPEPWWKFW